MFHTVMSTEIEKLNASGNKTVTMKRRVASICFSACYPTGRLLNFETRNAASPITKVSILHRLFSGRCSGYISFKTAQAHSELYYF